MRFLLTQGITEFPESIIQFFVFDFLIAPRLCLTEEIHVRSFLPFRPTGTDFLALTL